MNPCPFKTEVVPCFKNRDKFVTLECVSLGRGNRASCKSENGLVAWVRGSRALTKKQERGWADG